MHFLDKLIRYAPDTGFGETAKKRSRRTARSVIYGDLSTSIDFDVTFGNVLPSLQAPTDTSGDITLTYTLKSIDSLTASILAEYSKNGGTTWNTATSAGGDDGISPLTSSPAGTSHTFEWDTVVDVGIDFFGTVLVRVRAFDLPGQGGDFIGSEEHKLTVDNAPLAGTIVSPASGDFNKIETPTFVFTIADPNQGNSDLHVKLEIDVVDSFDSGSLVTFESRLDQVGWEYDSDGAGAWVAIPHDGIPIIATPALIGNQARYTIQTEDKLTQGEKHVRVTFGGVTS